MISLILKCYLTILLSVCAVSIFILIAGLYFIFRKPAPKHVTPRTDTPSVKTIHETVSANDLSAISGADVMSTQLDLARAYIETDRKQLAKNILEQVLAQGDAPQQAEAQQLLNYI
jgi:FimV-like protein